MVPCHYTWHRVFLYTLRLVLCSRSDEKTLVQDENVRALVTGRSIQAPLIWNNLPAHIRYCKSLS